MKKESDFTAEHSDTKLDDLSVVSRFAFLENVNIGIVGGGGIAAIELPKVARELRRYGATVRFYVTENCLRFIGREALEWASGHNVMVTPTGFADHICRDDVVLVVPGTADLLGKIANGICSDGASTYLQSAIGQNKLVLICPTMHKSLSTSQFVIENIERISKQKNIVFLSPRKEEGKLKAPDSHLLAKLVSHFYNRNLLADKKRFLAKSSPKKQLLAMPKVLITLGGSRSQIDAVRCLANISTGRLGEALVDELYCRGFSVVAVVGQSEISISGRQDLEVYVKKEFGEILALLKSLLPTDYVGFFHTAALSDYLYKGDLSKKISSQNSTLELKFAKAPKMIDLVNLRKISYRFACKLTETSEKIGVGVAREFLESHKLNGVLWNNASSAFGSAEHKGIVVTKSGKEEVNVHASGKQKIACLIAQNFEDWYLG